MRALSISCFLAVASWPSAQCSDFTKDVLPILNTRCLPCHDAATHTSGFVATDIRSVVAGGARHGQAVKPGEPAGSILIKMLRGTVAPRMPMGKELPEAEISIIENWIREDMARISSAAPKSQSWWAFQKPIQHPPPSPSNTQWVRNDVDRFILARLEKKGLQPSPEADKRTLARRLYFDLVGLPPSPEEIKQFVEDRSAGAYEKLVDKILADPRYGERWGRHWLDLARYADTNGYEGDPEWPHAWRYRDYVIDAFNNDKPYNEFIREQIAGDEFFQVVSAVPAPPPEPERAVALSFLRLAPFNRTPVSDENRDSLLSEMTSTVGSVFLGLTVGCAKCHDHKYDMIPTRDFYRMKAFFSTVQITNTGRAGGYEPADFYRPGEKAAADAKRDLYAKQLAAAEAELEEYRKPLIARLAALRKAEAKPDSKEVTFKDVEQLINADNNNAVALNGKKDDTFSAEEVRRYREQVEQIARLKKRVERLEPMCMGLRNADGPPMGPSVPVTHVQVRGDYNTLGEAVEPGFLSALTGNTEPAALELDRYKMFPTRGRRMTLANWIASAENPLTARVMVNRIWQHHFGKGIVDTPSDFGKNGSPPSHPELLDWLALRFTQDKWSIKSIHRLLVTSATYRQDSRRLDKKAAEIDPENALLWRFNRQRLEGEAVRDSVLAISGRLNTKSGGVPVYPPMPSGVAEVNVQGVNTWETSGPDEARRRSVYIFQRRAQHLPLLETFDAPVYNAPCERRRNSVSALQALSLYDGDFVNEEARAFADRVRREAGPDPREQVERAFLLAFGRVPDRAELADAVGFLEDKSEKTLPRLCRVLLNSNELIYID